MLPDEPERRLGKPIDQPVDPKAGRRARAGISQRVVEPGHPDREVGREPFVEVKLAVVSAVLFDQAPVAGIGGGDLQEDRGRRSHLGAVPLEGHPEGLAGKAPAAARCPGRKRGNPGRVDSPRLVQRFGQPVCAQVRHGLRNRDGEASGHR